MKDDAAKSIPNRLAALTLGVWSTLMLYFYFGGRLRAFLAPDFRPYVLWAGLTMAVMALVLFFAGGKLHACADDLCGRPSGRGKQWTCFVLLMPVLIAIIAGDSDTFSAAMIANRGEITHVSALGLRPIQAPLRSRESVLFPLPVRAGTPPEPIEPDTTSPQDWLPRTAEGNIKIEVLDLLFAAQEVALRADFDGKTVELTGQFMLAKTGSPNGNRFKCVRMFMACCAADARPIAILVECDTLPKVHEMKWVRITGTAAFPIERGKRMPVLRAQKVEPCPPPEERFVF